MRAPPSAGPAVARPEAFGEVQHERADPLVGDRAGGGVGVGLEAAMSGVISSNIPPPLYISLVHDSPYKTNRGGLN
jgi:hypothetical protein